MSIITSDSSRDALTWLSLRRSTADRSIMGSRLRGWRDTPERARSRASRCRVIRRAFADRWRVATFGARHPSRRIAALALLGTVIGVGEALVVLLLVALASRGSSHRLPGFVPHGNTWMLAGLTLGAVAVLAAAHLAAAWTAARASADTLRTV